MTYYECEAYLRKGLGNDLVQPFLIFQLKSEGASQYRISGFFDPDFDTTLYAERNGSQKKLDLWDFSFQGQTFRGKTHTFQRGEPVEFMEFVGDQATIRLKCDPRELN
jgi:hypothetical protein